MAKMMLKTVQGSMFKNLMESMKETLNDCNIICRPDGLECTGLDASHVSIAHFKLFAEGVEAYRCDGTYTLGINTQYFHRFLKNVSGHDLLELNYYENDPDNLSMAIRNPESGTRRVKMRLLHLEDSDLAGMPDADYNMILTMPSNDLQRIIREMLPNGETVRVTCHKVDGERQVTFTTSGEAGDISCDLNLEMDRMEVEQFEDIDMLVRSIPCIGFPLEEQPAKETDR